MAKLAPLTREARIALFPATALAVAVALLFYRAPWTVRLGFSALALLFSWMFLFPLIGMFLEREAAKKRFERWLSLSQNRCPRCDYDISATPMRCPECGFHIAPLYEPFSAENAEVD